MFKLGMTILLLAASLIGCGGGGGSSGTGISNLFVGDSGNHKIGSLVNANPPVGPIVTDRVLDIGTEVLGFAMNSIADTLYVADGTGIRRITNAGIASGVVTSPQAASFPSYSMSGLVNGVYLDTANDRLYASDRPNGIVVYSNASTIVDAAPTHRFYDAGTAGFSVHGVVVDVPRNIAYVLATDSGTLNAVYVYDNASTLNGNVAPNRIITLSFSVAGSSLALDQAHDRLYVGTAGSRVLAFNSVSTQSGSPTPDKVVLLPGESAWTKPALNSANDRLYAVTGASAFIVANISTANGAVAATQANAAPGGQLTAILARP